MSTTLTPGADERISIAKNLADTVKRLDMHGAQRVYIDVTHLPSRGGQVGAGSGGSHAPVVKGSMRACSKLLSCFAAAWM